MKKVATLIILAALLAAGCSKSSGTAPVAPSNLDTVMMSPFSIGLTWRDNSDNEQGFKIERSTSEADGFQVVATQPGNTESYVDYGLSANAVYYYRVKAVNSSGESVSNTSSARTESPDSSDPNITATLRIYNRTRYPVISLGINVGYGAYQLIKSPDQVIPPDTYRDILLPLSADTLTISYCLDVGFWYSGGTQEPRFTFWDDCVLTAGQTTTAAAEATLAQVLSNFKSYSDWRGDYYTGDPPSKYSKYFRFYSNGTWWLYDTKTASWVASGVALLVRWENYSDSIYFKLRVTDPAPVDIGYTHARFSYQNGPTDWPYIDYVLQP